jgi:uncharacterized membrane protein
MFFCGFYALTCCFIESNVLKNNLTMKQTPVLLLGIGLVVWACKPEASTSTAQKDKVISQPAVFEYSCRGTKPSFWLIEIYKDSIVYLRAGLPKILYPYQKAQVQGDSTRYTTKTRLYGKETKLFITVLPDSCRDGRSDAVYPFTAIIERDGETLHGCATSEPLK